MIAKQTVLLLFGGESPEYDVSIMSARNVFAALDNEKYDVYLGYISKAGGEWLLVDSFDDLDGSEFLPMLGQGYIATQEDEIKVDVVFPILHGSHGEDGTVQGLVQLLHARVVGPSVLGAAVTMNKDMTKRLLGEAGIPVVPWRVWRTRDLRPEFGAVCDELRTSALFVKPNSAGSSVGAARATDEDAWERALDEAARHDEVVLIEKSLDVREIELAVIGNDELRVSGAGEIIPGEEFYSYDDKYSPDAVSRVEIPAVLETETLEQLQAYARKAYQATAGQGMARIDFFVTKLSGEIYLNEINSIPGFTDISMYPKLWANEGVSYSALLDQLIKLAR